jgi:hypothetical protein
MEALGYLMLTVALLFAAPVFAGGRAERAIRGLFVLSFVLAVTAFVGLAVAPDGRVRGHRDRARDRGPDRRTSRGPRLGGGHARRRRDLRVRPSHRKGGGTLNTTPIEILLVEDNPDDVELTLRALNTHKLANRVKGRG